jgi:hypothetical protein
VEGDRWHVVEVAAGGDYREENCYVSRRMAWMAVILKVAEMEERGWVVEACVPKMGYTKVSWPPPWKFGKEGDERPHVFHLRECKGHEEAAKVGRGVGRYENFRVVWAVAELDPRIEMHHDTVKATARVRYTCGHHATVETYAMSEGEARDDFVSLMRGRCPDCRRASPSGM